MTSPPTMSASDALPLEEQFVVRDDLPCVACGYNLRGLPLKGNCPECGLAIEATLADVLARPRQLRRLAIGSLLIALSIALTGIAFPIAESIDRVFGPGLLSLLAIAGFIGAVGSWGFASPKFPEGAAEPTGWLSMWLRVAAIVLVTLQGVAYWRMIEQALFGRPGSPTWATVDFAEILLVWAVCSALAMTRAAQLAKTIRDRPGIVQARLLSFAVPLTLICLAAAVATARSWLPWAGSSWPTAFIVAVSAVGTWSAIFFAGFSLRLRAAAKRALITRAFVIVSEVSDLAR